MGTFDIGNSDNTPKAQSQSTYMVTHRTQEQMERTLRENYAMLDEVEPGMNLGAFPFGYAPINTTR